MQIDRKLNEDVSQKEFENALAVLNASRNVDPESVKSLPDLSKHASPVGRALRIVVLGLGTHFNLGSSGGTYNIETHTSFKGPESGLSIPVGTGLMALETDPDKIVVAKWDNSKERDYRYPGLYGYQITLPSFYSLLSASPRDILAIERGGFRHEFYRHTRSSSLRDCQGLGTEFGMERALKGYTRVLREALVDLTSAL